MIQDTNDFISINYQRPATITDDDFLIFHVNARSLRHKLPDLEAEIRLNEYPQIIVITETWLTESIKNSYDINSYTAYHTIRQDGYGGLTIYIRDDIQHQVTMNLSNIDRVHITRIHIDQIHMNLLCVYRAPSTNMMNFLNLLDELLENSLSTIICGDFNINLLSTDSYVNEYRNIIEANSFQFLNEIDPNAFTFPITNGNMPGSIIDHFMTDMFDKEYFLENKPSIADHHSLLLGIRAIQIQTYIPTRTYRNNQRIQQELQNYLANANTTSLIEIHNVIRDIIKRNTYKKHLTRDVKIPWMNQQILREMRKRNNLYHMYKQSLNERMSNEAIEHNKQLYNQQRNNVTRMVRKARKDFIEKLVQDGIHDSKRMWQAMKYIFRKKTAQKNDLPNSLETEDGSETTDPQTMVETFNKYFVNVGDQINLQLSQDFNSRPRNYIQLNEANASIHLYNTNQRELTKIIKSLKSHAAAGIDGICPKDMKVVISQLSKALVTPINECLKHGIFPVTFKETKIKAIYKGKGSKKSPTNYRPITVLSNLSKIFEKLLYQRLYNFLQSQNIISEKQFGFLPQASTTTAALHAITRIQKSLDDSNMKSTAALFIDVAKAFDSVNHSILLEKVKSMGIRGKAFAIIQDYLFGRKQVVQTGDYMSNRQFMKHGVPQGSSLSSFLFLIYVNDCLQLNLHGYIQMYADDTVIIYSSCNDQELFEEMQADLHKINTWMYDNHMSFNATKTEFILFKRKHQQPRQLPPIYVNGTQINQTSQTKYLGLIIDEALTWKPHIEHMKKTLIPYIYVLRQTRYLMPRSTKISLYYSYIHSRLTYMSAIWGYGNVAFQNQLQVIQNKAVRNLFWQEYREPNTNTNDLYERHSILRVNNIIKFNSMLMIYKIKNKLIRNHIELSTFRQTHHYNTRRGNDFIIPPARTNILYNSNLVKGLSEYNALPTQLKNEQDPHLFKRSLKSFMSESE